MKSDVGPFSIIPEWVLLSGVSAEAVRLYALLGRYANSEGEAWPSVETMAERLGSSARSVQRQLKELAKANTIQIVTRKDEKGNHLTNLYIVHYCLPPGDKNDTDPGDKNVTQTITNKNENKYTEEFERFWGVYPKRSGANPKGAALTSFRRRIKEGADPETIIGAAGAYARWCSAQNLVGTPYVKQAVSWLSPTYRGWEQGWEQDWGGDTYREFEG